MDVSGGKHSSSAVILMREILVVDLDHTLLKSDMLFESFWSAFGRSWSNPIRAAQALLKSKAAVKRYLAESADIEVSSLPYDQEVVDFIVGWRTRGGRTALVTASDSKFARAIAEHLGIFDEVHGSNGAENLKGNRKARFLVNRYGEKQFSYVGDSESDLPVWRHAKMAITVNLSNKLKKRVDQIADETTHLETHKPTLASYLRAIRPHQWAKNFLVFLPMLAAHQFDLVTAASSLLAFISFSLVASSVYVLNDLLDLNADRGHPRKRRRPFASGEIPIASGTWMAGGLLVGGGLVALLLGFTYFAVLLGYFMATLGYSINLKKRIVTDICILAGLYTLRIIAGGVASGISLSVWLLAFSIFFFLSLAAVKRQAELVDNVKEGKVKASGRGYHVDDLPIIAMISISSGYVSVLIMALYVNSPEVVELYAHPEALWGTCIVLLYWITRTVMLAHRGWMHDDPVVYATKDRISQIVLLIILSCVLAGATL